MPQLAGLGVCNLKLISAARLTADSVHVGMVVRQMPLAYAFALFVVHLVLPEANTGAFRGATEAPAARTPAQPPWIFFATLYEGGMQRLPSEPRLRPLLHRRCRTR